MRPKLFVNLLALLVVLSTLGTATVLADSPAWTGASNAPAVDNQKHTLPASSSTWYRFDYAVQDDGTRPVVLLTAIGANRSGFGFEVWTATQLTNLANTWDDAQADPVHNQPIGRGSAATINCDTGKLDGSGECQANDLTWQGAFGVSGAYYVRALNYGNAPIDFTLTIR